MSCWGTGSIRAFILLRNTNPQFTVWQRNYLNCSSYYIQYMRAWRDNEQKQEEKKHEQNISNLLDVSVFVSREHIHVTLLYN